MMQPTSEAQLEQAKEWLKELSNSNLFYDLIKSPMLKSAFIFDKKIHYDIL